MSYLCILVAGYGETAIAHIWTPKTECHYSVVSLESWGCPFVYVISLHCPHAKLHYGPFILHKHVFVSHFPVQLHLMILNKDTGTTACPPLCGFQITPCWGLRSAMPIQSPPCCCLARPEPECRPAGCGICRHHMPVEDAHSFMVAMTWLPAYSISSCFASASCTR